MMKINKVLGLGAGLGAVSWALGRFYSWIIPSKGIATATFSTFPLDLPLGINVKQQILTGVDKSLASQLLATLGGGEISAMMGIIMALIAGIVVAFVGVYTVNFLKSQKFPLTGKNSIGKITAIMVWGTIISGGIASFLGGTFITIPALGFVIALIIYYLIVGWAYVLLRNLGLKILQEPE